MPVLLALLRAVLGPALLAAFDAEAVQRPADHVVADTGKVAHAPAAHQDDRVLLQVVPLAADVRRDFLAVAEPYAGDLSQSGVGLLRSRSADDQAHAALLRARGQILDLRLCGQRAAGVANQLIDRG